MVVDYVIVSVVTIVVVLLILFLILLGILGKFHDWLHLRKHMHCQTHPEQYVLSDAEQAVLYGHADHVLAPRQHTYLPEFVSCMYRLNDLASYLRCPQRRKIRKLERWAPGFVCATHFFNRNSLSVCLCECYGCMGQTVLRSMFGCCGCRQVRRHYVGSAFWNREARTLCLLFATTRSLGHWQKDIRFKQKVPDELRLAAAAAATATPTTPTAGSSTSTTSTTGTAGATTSATTTAGATASATTTAGATTSSTLATTVPPSSSRDESPIRLHAGMYEICRQIMPSIVNLVLATRPDRIFCAGQSLGGALATIVTHELDAHRFPFDPLFAIATFGQPRIGNLAFANHVAQRALSYARVFNTEDAIPNLPPSRITFGCCLDVEYAHAPSRVLCGFTRAEGSMTDNHCRAYEEWVYNDGCRLAFPSC